jgi:phage terminase large subunit-like protein
MNKKSLQKVLNGTQAERVYLVERDFSLFFVYYFCDYIKYNFATFHFKMFEDLKLLMTNKYRELAWLMFRESAKTSIAKAFALWLITFKKRKYINVDSFDRENAERILFDLVVEMQTNLRYKSDFGEMYNAKKKDDEVTQKRINNFITNNGVRVEAHSTQESVRGRIHGHQRPDFLLLDDFETNKTKDSKAYTEQVIKHIDEFKTGLDSTAKILYLGNYITEFGSIQTLLERAKTDFRLFVRMVAVEENGEPTWPEKYVMTDAEAEGTNKVSLEDKKRQFGSLVYSAEMLNRPIDESTQEFFKKNFKYRKLDEVLKGRVRKFVTIDSALTKNADSDFTGVVKNYVNENNDWNFIAKKYKINSKELISLIFQFHEEGFEKIGIEEGAFMHAVSPFFEDECRTRGKYPNIVKLKHKGTMKETRIRGLIPRYESGQIYHIEGECRDLEDELLKFPKGMHDDVADAAQYQNDVAQPPMRTVTYQQKPFESITSIGS